MSMFWLGLQLCCQRSEQLSQQQGGLQGATYGSKDSMIEFPPPILEHFCLFFTQMGLLLPR